jgi:hypothetical protein
MLTVEKFKAQLVRFNHPDHLHVAIDTKNKQQLYIITNGGIANIHCRPIEQYPDEIKVCALEMITRGELTLKSNEKSLRIGQGRKVITYSLTFDKEPVKTESNTQTMYFSSLFIRWQRTHQLSDEQAQEKLGLTAHEFHLFREDKLVVTQDLVNKLAEVTGVTTQFWQNRWEQKNLK